MYYDGGPLINDSETRTELAESEITKRSPATRKITYLSRGSLTFRQIALVRTSCPFMS